MQTVMRNKLLLKSDEEYPIRRYALLKFCYEWLVASHLYQVWLEI